MLSVPGIYQDGQVILLEKIPLIKHAKVIVTILEEAQLTEIDQTESGEAGTWLGSMAGTGRIIGDIVQPLEDTIEDWEVLKQ